MSSEDVWWVVKAGDADDLAEVLTKQNLDVNITNDQGRTLAHVAADYNYVSILKFLHSKSAKMDVRATRSAGRWCCGATRWLTTCCTAASVCFGVLRRSRARPKTSTASRHCCAPFGKGTPSLSNSCLALAPVRRLPPATVRTAACPLTSTWQRVVRRAAVARRAGRREGQDPRWPVVRGSCGEGRDQGSLESARLVRRARL